MTSLRHGCAMRYMLKIIMLTCTLKVDYVHCFSLACCHARICLLAPNTKNSQRTYLVICSFYSLYSHIHHFALEFIFVIGLKLQSFNFTFVKCFGQSYQIVELTTFVWILLPGKWVMAVVLWRGRSVHSSQFAHLAPSHIRCCLLPAAAYDFRFNYIPCCFIKHQSVLFDEHY